MSNAQRKMMAAKYGVMETNPLKNPQQYHSKERRVVRWSHPGLKVTRLRLLGDPGLPYLDVSYCHGQLADGELVRVQLPFNQIPCRGWKGFIITAGRRDRVYVKGLGILDNASILR